MKKIIFVLSIVSFGVLFGFTPHKTFAEANALAEDGNPGDTITVGSSSTTFDVMTNNVSGVNYRKIGNDQVVVYPDDMSFGHWLIKLTEVDEEISYLYLDFTKVGQIQDPNGTADIEFRIASSLGTDMDGIASGIPYVRPSERSRFLMTVDGSDSIAYLVYDPNLAEFSIEVENNINNQ